MNPTDATPPSQSVRGQRKGKAKTRSMAGGKKPSSGRRDRGRSLSKPDHVGNLSHRDLGSPELFSGASTLPVEASELASTNHFAGFADALHSFSGASPVPSATNTTAVTPGTDRGVAQGAAGTANMNASPPLLGEAPIEANGSVARPEGPVVDVPAPPPAVEKAAPQPDRAVSQPAAETDEKILSTQRPSHKHSAMGRPLYIAEGLRGMHGKALDPSCLPRPLPGDPSRGQPPRASVDAKAEETRSRLWITSGSIVGAIFVIVLAYLVITSASSRSSPTSNTCTSFACRYYSKRLLASVNKSVNPCQSFTRFVCDGWQRNNPLSVWEDQLQQVLKTLDTTLQKVEWPSRGQDDEQRAAAVYKSCDDVLQGKSDQLPEVKAALAEAGIVWPQPSRGADALYTLLYCSLNLGWDALLRFHFERSGGDVTLVLSPGKSFSVLTSLYIRPRASTAKRAYFEFLTKSFEKEGNDTITYDLTSARDEHAMSNLTQVVNEVIRISPAGDIFEIAENIDLAATRWTATLSRLNVAPNATPLLLSATHPEYLCQVVKLWKTFEENGFHEFVSWCTVQVAALYANRDLIINYYDSNLHAAGVYHAAFCISRAAYFSMDAVFAKYNGDVLQGNAEDIARHMALSVRRAFFRRLLHWRNYDENITVIANWSSLSTVFRSFEYRNLRKSGKHQLLPDMTDSLVKNWRHSVLIKNTPEVENTLYGISVLSFYIIRVDKRDFQLMPYSLQYPFFDPDFPASVNYGGLGADVAHAASFLFFSSYESSKPPLILPFINCMLNGSLSNISDNSHYLPQVPMLGSLVDAFKSSGPDLDKSVPGFESYTGLQTLFISYCYYDCEGRDNEVGEAVCDLALQYVPEFAQAFNCSPGDPMFPSQQCRLF